MNLALLALASALLVREERKHTVVVTEVAAAAARPPNLDEECSAFFCSAPCKREYVWLDTAKQSCRYPEEYKLLDNEVVVAPELMVTVDKDGVVASSVCEGDCGEPEEEALSQIKPGMVITHVDGFPRSADRPGLLPPGSTIIVGNAARFVPVELNRLLEKSRTFAAHGCILGGWWKKCYRRMRQLLRLQSFLSKVDQSMLQTPASQTILVEVRSNLLTGFEKWEKRHEGEDPPCFVRALKMVMLAENVYEHVEAMLAVNCITLGEAQRENFRARIEIVDTDTSGEPSQEQFADSLMADLDAAWGEDGKTEVENEKASDVAPLTQSVVRDSGAELEDRDSVVDGDGDASLSELSFSNSSELAMAGNGPLKVLFTKPLAALGWFFTRLAWLFIFTGGFLWNVAKVAVFTPVGILGCLLIRFADWFFVDLMYHGGWEGDSRFLQTYKNMGKCPKDVWDFLISEDMKGSKFFKQPARFASMATGVWNLFKEVDPCDSMTCGDNSRCYLGECLCHTGFYSTAMRTAEGDESSYCAPAITSDGCWCQAGPWVKKPTFGRVLGSLIGIGSSTAFGCHANECLTDTARPCSSGIYPAPASYAHCSSHNWLSDTYKVPALPALPPRKGDLPAKQALLEE